eukprot:m.260293 g.260293  ORF g.260293 m.260293 type:complete len:1229 (-) comp19214_c0_seq2:102-3788(-)
MASAATSADDAPSSTADMLLFPEAVAAGVEVVPTGLLGPHRGLVRLVGLDPWSATAPEAHRAIWSALHDKQPAVLTYQLSASAEAAVPTKKHKKAQRVGLTEEDYVPDGILKANWLPKHLNEVPSVVVLFVELEWAADDWDTHQTACAEAIAKLRSRMGSRPIKVVTVLLQKNILADGDPVLDKRAVSLRTACGLSTKSSLFVLHSTSPGLKSTVQRLESAFVELSQVYYGEEQARVRQKIELLNPVTEVVMYIRYACKSAAFFELKTDLKAALREYQVAYKLIKEHKPAPLRLHETKVVAGVINAKVCSLLFRTQAPVDALKQFAQHVTFYKRLPGPDELAFLHWGFLAQQNYMFAEIFGEAVTQGLNAIQTEHPGFYFRHGARALVKRHECVQSVCRTDERARSAMEFVHREPAVFVGQPAVSKAENAPEPVAALDSVTLLRAAELKVPLLDATIGLFMRARQHFQRFNLIRVSSSPPQEKQLIRFVNHLNMDIADKLAATGRHKAALKFLGPAMELYREEGWRELLTATLCKALQCAYSCADAEAYAHCALELSGADVTRTGEQRMLAQRNFDRLLNKQIPAPDGGEVLLSGDGSGESAVGGLWEGVFAAQLPFESLPMQRFRGCIDCKVAFSELSTSCSGNLTLLVAFRSLLPTPVTLSKLQIKLNQPAFASAKLLSEGQPAETREYFLIPDTTKVFVVSFSNPANTNMSLRCTEVSACLVGTAHDLRLQWPIDKPPPSSFALPPTTPADLADQPWATVCSSPTVRLSQPPCSVQLELVHTPPVLVNEQYRVRVRLCNQEPDKLTSVTLKVCVFAPGSAVPSSSSGTFSRAGSTASNASIGSAGVGDGSASSSGSGGSNAATRVPSRACRFLVTDKDTKAQRLAHECTLGLGDVAPGATVEHEAVVVFETLGEKHVLSAAASFSTSAGDAVVQRSKEVLEELDSVIPLDVSFRLQTVDIKPLPVQARRTAVPSGEPFLLLAEAKCRVPFAVRVLKTELRLGQQNQQQRVDGAGEDKDNSNPVSYPFLASSNNNSCFATDLSLTENEVSSSCCCLRVGAQHAAEPLSLGLLAIGWKRDCEYADELPLSWTLYKLPEVDVLRPPLIADVAVPSVGEVFRPLPFVCTVTNTTELVQEVEVHVEPSDHFMLSGQQHCRFSIPPGDTIGEHGRRSRDHVIRFTLFPLLAGANPLPQLKVTNVRANAAVAPSGSGRVYILPHHNAESEGQ